MAPEHIVEMARMSLEARDVDDHAVTVILADHAHLQDVRAWATAHPNRQLRPFASSLAEGVIRDQVATIKRLETRASALIGAAVVAREILLAEAAAISDASRIRAGERLGEITEKGLAAVEPFRRAIEAIDAALKDPR